MPEIRAMAQEGVTMPAQDRYHHQTWDFLFDLMFGTGYRKPEPEGYNEDDEQTFPGAPRRVIVVRPEPGQGYGRRDMPPMTTKEQQAEWDQECVDLGRIVQREVNREFGVAGNPKDGLYALSTEMLRILGGVVARRQNKAWVDGHEGKVNGILNRIVVPPQEPAPEPWQGWPEHTPREIQQEDTLSLPEVILDSPLGRLRQAYHLGGENAVWDYLYVEMGSVNWAGLAAQMDVRASKAADLKVNDLGELTNLEAYRDYWHNDDLRRIHDLLKKFVNEYKGYDYGG